MTETPLVQRLLHLTTQEEREEATREFLAGCQVKLEARHVGLLCLLVGRGELTTIRQQQAYVLQTRSCEAAAAMGCDRKTYQKAVTDLRSAGLIDVEETRPPTVALNVDRLLRLRQVTLFANSAVFDHEQTRGWKATDHFRVRAGVCAEGSEAASRNDEYDDSGEHCLASDGRPVPSDAPTARPPDVHSAPIARPHPDGWNVHSAPTPDPHPDGWKGGARGAHVARDPRVLDKKYKTRETRGRDPCPQRAHSAPIACPHPAKGEGGMRKAEGEEIEAALAGPPREGWPERPWHRTEGVTGEQVRWCVRQGRTALLRWMYLVACDLRWWFDCDDHRLRFLAICHHCATSEGIDNPAALLVAMCQSDPPLDASRVRQASDQWAAGVLRKWREKEAKAEAGARNAE